MSGMGGNTHERDAEEPFRNDFRDFQGVKLLLSPFRQHTIGRFAQGSWPLNTKGHCPDLTGQIEEVPPRFLDFSTKFVPIKISDCSPARQEGFTFDRQVCRQRCVFPNQNGPCSISVWHLSCP